MRPINKIIIQTVDIESIQALISKHLEEGMPMVGFHYMIGKDANCELGRPISIIGNHFIGENATSIGIVIIGKEISTQQASELDILIEEIKLRVPSVKDIFVFEDGKLKERK